jgi:DNA-binding transcriptional ArsR family regulator
MVNDQLSALADPTRRAIFEMLASGGPRGVAEVAQALPVSRPAVSQHLKVLVDAGLVVVTVAGRRRIHQVDPPGLRVLRSWIDDHWGSVLDHFAHAARTEAAAMSTHTRIAPVVKTRTVPLAVAPAFELFTRRLAEWWPTATHSISADAGGSDRVVDIRFDGRVGGRVTEVTSSGAEHSWADVVAWDPPHRFVLSWHPRVAPTAASRLEVRFRTVDDGTEVLVEHGGWEEFGDDGVQLRESYDGGWEHVLDRLVGAVQPTAR